MNAKEKATELVDKFNDCLPDLFLGEENATYCALLAVDQIIESLKITTGHLTIKRLLEKQELQMDFDFWNNVKNELEAMI